MKTDNGGFGKQRRSYFRSYVSNLRGQKKVPWVPLIIKPSLINNLRVPGRTYKPFARQSKVEEQNPYESEVT
jgi:hypothetical protein